MKILGFIFLFLFGIFFSVPFKVIETSKQEMVGGRMESGRSVVFTFKMLAKKSSAKIQFEDVWIGTRHYTIKASHQNADNTISTDFEKGDTIYFQATEQFLPKANGELQLLENKNKKNVPIEYAGQALIGYKFKGKQHYYEVEEFKKMQTVNRP